MKRYLIILAVITLACVAGVIVLYAISDKGIPQRDYSFSRVIEENVIEQGKTIDMTYNSYYIAGVSDDRIYLGNVTGYLNLLTAKADLSDTTHLKYKIKDFKPEAIRIVYVKIREPYFYLVDGIAPALYRGKLGVWEADRFMHDSAYFINAQPISRTSFAMRTMRANTGQYVLGKLNPQPPYVTLVPGLLQKQIDGLFCVDGMLHYNEALAQVVYTYYYRNEYMVMDTSLNLLYRAHTIDTFAHVKIKPGDVTATGTRMLASPPKLVNKTSCVWDKYLLVNSAIMSATDDEEQFLRTSVIDVYDLTKQAYQFSFYLPAHDRRPARELIICNQRLIALYDNYLTSYALSAKYFNVGSAPL